MGTTQRFGRAQSSSPAMQAVFHTLRRVAPFDLNVLLTGASGVGKTRLAQDIHLVSPRKDHAFVTLECASVPDALLESELFGHVEGAFTGAVSARDGVFVRADGGTLLLDEVGAASPALQVALLRALEEGRITPLGDFQSRSVDVRVIATTSLALADAVADGRFRADLFYRLAVVVVDLPPLAARPEDIVPLADAMLRDVVDAWKLPERVWSDEAQAALCQHPWPGNLRELDNAVKRAAALATDTAIEAELLPFVDARTLPTTGMPHSEASRPPTPHTDAHQTASDASSPANSALSGAWAVGEHLAIRSDVFSLRTLQRELEAMAIERAMAATGGNQSQAARLLDISRRKLVYTLNDNRPSSPVEPAEVEGADE